MPDRSRKYTPDWVRRAMAGEVLGPDASVAKSLAEQCPGEGVVTKIADAMEAWVGVDQSGDPDRLDFWPDFKRVAVGSICP